MKPVFYRIAIITGIILSAIVFSVYLLYKTYTGFNEQLVQRTALLLGGAVEETLRNAVDQNLEVLTRSEKNRLRQLMSSMTTESGSIIHILLINSKMTILLSSDRSIEGHQYKSAEEIAQLQGDEPRVISKNWEGNFRIIDVIIPLKNAQDEVYSYLRLVLSYKELHLFFADLAKVFLPLAMVFTLLLVLLMYLLAKSYSQPLDSLRQAAQRLSSGDFDYRINYSRKDEFTDTFLQINKSIEKVNVLRESYKTIEKRISALLSATEESSILVDADEKLSSFNPAAVKLLKCPPGNNFDAHFKKIKSANKELRQIIKQAILGEETQTTHELVLWLPDEEQLLVRVSTQSFRENERLNGVLLTFKDVHLLNELERNLQRSMKFGVIANLASSISHEIRNPLSSLAMHAEHLNSRIRKTGLKDSDTAFKSLAVLQSEVNRLHRIISQFLNLARARETTLVQLKINAVINDVLVLVQQQSIERNITIETTLDESLDFIYGDADQLKQVILNIILNAFQAIDKNGTVYIRSRQSNQRILVEIQDTGKGMPADVQDKIFNLYFSTKEDGGGIGLAISKNIMQAHEGRITFESAKGKGAIFFLDFPRKEHTQTLAQRVKQKTKK